MNRSAHQSGLSGRCAVRKATNRDEERALARHLERERLTEVVRFSDTHDDELDAELCAGRFERVIFANLDALFAGIWNGHSRVDRWTEAGVQIELADRPVEDSLVLQELITHVHASLWRWRRQKRKQQIVAASILSALALIAMAVLFWLVPPAT